MNAQLNIRVTDTAESTRNHVPRPPVIMSLLTKMSHLFWVAHFFYKP
jgi:hypothetical protein